MQFLSPIWFFALAALSIPVIIHLWNIRPGKTLKVGSIALFSESSPKSSRSFKVQDLLLLAIRCLLLIILTILLTNPLWRQQLRFEKTKGWILISRPDFTEAYHLFKRKIDSLNTAGYEFHYFEKGFAKQDLAELKKAGRSSTHSNDTANYWLLARSLADKIPAGVAVDIFSANGINHFKGDKPETPLTINWHTFIPVDSVSNFLAAAWLTSNGGIRVVKGTAKPTGTSYQYVDIKNGGQANSTYDVNVENGVPIVWLKDHPKMMIAADTSVQHIAIYTDKYLEDAAYLKAALEAVSQLTQRRTVIKTYSQSNFSGNQGWIFWLSDASVSQQILHLTKNLFQYQSGPANNVDTWLGNSDDHTITQGASKISLYRSIKPVYTFKPVWTDGFGNTILNCEQGKTNRFRFYSRFSPSWSDLVWSEDFPKWILSLTENSAIKNTVDKRAISPDQLQPVHITGGRQNALYNTELINLKNYCWLLVIILFFAERWLATRNKTLLTNG